MNIENYKQDIENLWGLRQDSPESFQANREQNAKLVNEVIELLDQGKIYVTYKDSPSGNWLVNEWVKKAILLNFSLSEFKLYDGESSKWYDKIDPKFLDAKEQDFKEAGCRVVPGAFIRKGSYIGPNTVVMPSFINIGAHIKQGCMIDSWATIGSCAHIGENSHISGGAGIGGVLEPLQASPVIIEDNCFIGARSEIVEGVIIGEGSVISMGVFIGASTKIVDRQTGKITYGKIPPYSVVVPGSLPATQSTANNADNNGSSPLPSLYCAVIIKQVDSKTRSKTSINELLRE